MNTYLWVALGVSLLIIAGTALYAYLKRDEQ